VVQVLFVLLFAMFACIVIAAALGTFYPERTKLPKISLVAFGVATLGTVVYSTTMAIIHALAPDAMGFVVDVSILLLPAVSVLFAAVLSFLWLLVWRMVTTDKAGAGQMRFNAIVFFVASVVLAACFAAECVLASLYLFVDFRAFATPLLVLQTVDHVLMVAADLGYVGTAVIGAVRGKLQHDRAVTANSGYVPLQEGKVPSGYSNF
jgi:hypothetical protein